MAKTVYFLEFVEPLLLERLRLCWSAPGMCNPFTCVSKDERMLDFEHQTHGSCCIDVAGTAHINIAAELALGHVPPCKY